MTERMSDEMEAEIRSRHQPRVHTDGPCPIDGCCICGAVGGCETEMVLAALAESRAEVDRLTRAAEINKQAYALMVQAADGYQEERDSARAQLAAMGAYAMALRGDLVVVTETEDYTLSDVHMQGTLDEDVAALAAASTASTTVETGEGK